MSLRTLQRRVVKIEKGRKPRPSPFIIMCGSFEEFADATYAEVVEGRLDRQFLHILDTLREWDGQEVWALAYAR